MRFVKANLTLLTDFRWTCTVLKTCFFFLEVGGGEPGLDSCKGFPGNLEQAPLVAEYVTFIPCKLSGSKAQFWKKGECKAICLCKEA